MKKAGADVHVIAALDDVCWITNLRGDDVDFFRLLLSYAVITMDEMKLYIDERKLNDDMKADLEETTSPSIRIMQSMRTSRTKTPHLRFWIPEPVVLNYALFNNIPGGTKVVQQVNPTIAMKAKKNDVEIRNIINAHKKDAVAMTKWMYWLKQISARSRSQNSVLLPNLKHCVKNRKVTYGRALNRSAHPADMVRSFTMNRLREQISRQRTDYS